MLGPFLRYLKPRQLIIMFWILLSLAFLYVSAEDQEHSLNLKLGDAEKLMNPSYPESEDVGKIVWNLNSEPGTNIKIVCDDLRIAPTDLDVSEEDVEKRCEKGYVTIKGHSNNPPVKNKICDSAFGVIAKSKDNSLTVEFNLIQSLGVINCKAKAYKDDGKDDDDSSSDSSSDSDSSSEERRKQ